MRIFGSIFKTVAAGICAAFIGASALAATPTEQCYNFKKAQDYPRAVQAAREGVRQNPRDGDAQFCLGASYAKLGEIDLALKALLQAEQLFSKKSDLALVYMNLGVVVSDKGDLQQALNYHSRALGLCREIADRGCESTQLNNIAVVFQDRGDFDKALDYYQQSLNLKPKEANSASTYNNIAMVYSVREEYAKAVEYIEQSISMDRRFGNYHSAARETLNKGSVQISQGNYDAAEKTLDEGLIAIRKVGDKNWESIGIGYFGQLARARGNLELAKAKYQEALDLARSIGATQHVETYSRILASLKKDATTVSYGVVEIGSKGVKAAAVTSFNDDQGRPRYQTGFKKSVNTDVIKGVMETGEFSTDAMDATAQATKALVDEMKTNSKNIGDNVFVAGSSALSFAMNRDELGARIKALTGIEPKFINSSQEMMFALVGSVPDEYSHKTALLDIGSGNGRIGYLISARGDRKAGQATIDLRAGSVSLADLANKNRAPGESFVAALNRMVEKEIAPRFASDVKQYPVLSRHKYLVVVGGAAWAMSTLMYPENQAAYVALTLQDFKDYSDRISANPDAVLNPDLSGIADQKIRETAAKQVESVKKVFTVENLQAGARLLKLVADTVPVGKAEIFFGRDGNWAYGLAASIMSSRRLAKN